ncbi:MAG: peptidase [Firmicutes bacterium]|nr:peptidase [Bacillota bacterium]
MPKTRSKQKEATDIATKNFDAGYNIVSSNPIFSPLLKKASVVRGKNSIYRKDGLTLVTNEGTIFCNPTCRAEPWEWARAIAHSLLHLALGHFQKKERPTDWNIACDYVVEKFLSDFNFGRPIYQSTTPVGFSDEEKLYRHLSEIRDKSQFVGYGTSGVDVPDMLFGYNERHYNKWNKPPEWSKIFAIGLSDAVRQAVNKASGEDDNIDSDRSENTTAHQAKRWFISSYPLLGAIAANFKVIYDQHICERMDISVAAVSISMAEIYINPKKYLNQAEMRFVMAHEFLHAALRHDVRQEWRDPYLWNVACDFIINQWLTEMELGERPEGCLHDEQFKGMSAEAIYDRIANDMRMYRKLATLRGVGLGDMLPAPAFNNGKNSATDLDDFYRRALRQGLTYHQDQDRGYLPAGLVEEIRALAHPPIPWDVELARWFDDHFTPIEKKRSYARPSRRQSSTPDIPRPNWVISQASLDGRTFGVVLDTSGSMDRSLLATALGAIASYSASKDVPAARVVFCDAAAHDAGYMKPEDIAGIVKVRGRGGTVLQPGIDLLRSTEDFPKDAPILIITDAECDAVILYGREHAFLVPHSARLPFVPKGKVFRMR